MLVSSVVVRLRVLVAYVLCVYAHVNLLTSVLSSLQSVQGFIRVAARANAPGCGLRLVVSLRHTSKQ